MLFVLGGLLVSVFVLAGCSDSTHGGLPSDAKDGSVEVAGAEMTGAEVADGTAEDVVVEGVDAARVDTARVDATGVDAAHVDAAQVDAAAVDATASCTLPTALTFGTVGAFSAYTLVDELATSAILTIARTSAGTSLADGSSNPTCTWPLPPCETSGAVTAGTIAGDLADADVQAGFAAGATPLYGRAVPDAGIYSIKRADGHTIQVGWACDTGSAGTCKDIPPGVQRLVTDLQSLSSSALADPACHALNL